MSCDHKNLLTVDLSQEHHAELVQVLCESGLLSQNGSQINRQSLNPNFLTPGGRKSHRAQSCAAITEDSGQTCNIGLAGAGQGNNNQNTLSLSPVNLQFQNKNGLNKPQSNEPGSSKNAMTIQITNERNNEKVSMSPSNAQGSTADKTTSGFRSGNKRGYKGLGLLLSASKTSHVVDSYLQNCQDCGAIVFGAKRVLVTVLAEDSDDSDPTLKHFIHTQQNYLNGRKRIIDGVYKMGVKFRQARETIHIAIEMIDQYYLRMSQILRFDQFRSELLQPSAVILHQLTCLLVASKYDEIDDNITAIRDLREYISIQLASQNRRDSSLIPSFNDIVACEKKLLDYFQWDLKLLLPLHFVRLFLANGVLFSREVTDMTENLSSVSQQRKLCIELSCQITMEALSISDLIISKGNSLLRAENPSEIAAGIIFLARKNILEVDSPDGKPRVPQVWPQELIIMTRCSEQTAKRILFGALKPVDSAPSLKQSMLQQKEQEMAAQGPNTYQTSSSNQQKPVHRSSVPKSEMKKSTLSQSSAHQAREFSSQSHLKQTHSLINSQSMEVIKSASAAVTKEKIQKPTPQLPVAMKKSNSHKVEPAAGLKSSQALPNNGIGQENLSKFAPSSSGLVREAKLEQVIKNGEQQHASAISLHMTQQPLRLKHRSVNFQDPNNGVALMGGSRQASQENLVLHSRNSANNSSKPQSEFDQKPKQQDDNNGPSQHHSSSNQNLQDHIIMTTDASKSSVDQRQSSKQLQQSTTNSSSHQLIKNAKRPLNKIGFVETAINRQNESQASQKAINSTHETRKVTKVKRQKPLRTQKGTLRTENIRKSQPSTAGSNTNHNSRQDQKDNQQQIVGSLSTRNTQISSNQAINLQKSNDSNQLSQSKNGVTNTQQSLANPQQKQTTNQRSSLVVGTKEYASLHPKTMQHVNSKATDDVAQIQIGGGTRDPTQIPQPAAKPVIMSHVSQRSLQSDEDFGQGPAQPQQSNQTEVQSHRVLMPSKNIQRTLGRPLLQQASRRNSQKNVTQPFRSQKSSTNTNAIAQQTTTIQAPSSTTITTTKTTAAGICNSQTTTNQQLRSSQTRFFKRQTSYDKLAPRVQPTRVISQNNPTRTGQHPNSSTAAQSVRKQQTTNIVVGLTPQQQKQQQNHNLTSNAANSHEDQSASPAYGSCSNEYMTLVKPQQNNRFLHQQSLPQILTTQNSSSQGGDHPLGQPQTSSAQSLGGGFSQAVDKYGSKKIGNSLSYLQAPLGGQGGGQSQQQTVANGLGNHSKGGSSRTRGSFFANETQASTGQYKSSQNNISNQIGQERGGTSTTTTLHQLSKTKSQLFGQQAISPHQHERRDFSAKNLHSQNGRLAQKQLISTTATSSLVQQSASLKDKQQHGHSYSLTDRAQPILQNSKNGQAASSHFGKQILTQTQTTSNNSGGSQQISSHLQQQNHTERVYPQSTKHSRQNMPILQSINNYHQHSSTVSGQLANAPQRNDSFNSLSHHNNGGSTKQGSKLIVSGGASTSKSTKTVNHPHSQNTTNTHTHTKTNQYHSMTLNHLATMQSHHGHHTLSNTAAGVVEKGVLEKGGVAQYRRHTMTSKNLQIHTVGNAVTGGVGSTSGAPASGNPNASYTNYSSNQNVGGIRSSQQQMAASGSHSGVPIPKQSLQLIKCSQASRFAHENSAQMLHRRH